MPQQTKPRVLVDVDGCMANFIAPALEIAKLHFGMHAEHDMITEWEVPRALGIKDHEEIMRFYEPMRSFGYCRAIPPYTGAREALDELRAFADVRALTAPFRSKFWMHEREAWLVEVMGFDRKHIIFADKTEKPFHGGDYLIEDHVETVQAWSEVSNGFRHGILMDRPYNRAAVEATDPAWNVTVAKTWPEIVSTVIDRQYRRALRSAVKQLY